MDNMQNRNEQSLKVSFIEGAFASAMTGFTQEYFTPFLLLIGATVRHVSFLNALPNLFSAIIQVKNPDITDKLKSRKKMVNFLVFLQSIILIPMAITAFTRKTEPGFFIMLVVLFTSCGSLANPPWASMMSDLVKENKRGMYFGWRSRALGFVTVTAMFCAGFILHFMKKVDVFMGFTLLFFCAFLFRLVSWYFLKKMYEVPLKHTAHNHFTFYKFLAQIRSSNFVKFVIFVSLMNFSVNLASPFFSVLMIREMKFSYLAYTIITTAATLTIYSTIARWGRHADRVGNLKVIRITAPMVGFIPLLWIINRSPVFLFCSQIFSGFMWAGFNLCASNFIYDAVIPEKRTRCIAYFNVLNGTALCLGALIGGFLLPLLPELFGYKILMLFLISSLLRFAVGFFFPAKLKEVRPVESIKSIQLFFSMIGIKPILGIERKTI